MVTNDHEVLVYDLENGIPGVTIETGVPGIGKCVTLDGSITGANGINGVAFLRNYEGSIYTNHHFKGKIDARNSDIDLDFKTMDDVDGVGGTLNLYLDKYTTTYITEQDNPSYAVYANNLEPQNIKAGVKILGKTGTYEATGNSIDGVYLDYGPYGADTLFIEGNKRPKVYVNGHESGKIYLGNSGTEIDVNNSGVTLDIQQFSSINIPTPTTTSFIVTAENLEPQNIKAGVKILGKTGTYEGEGNSIDGVTLDYGPYDEDNLMIDGEKLANHKINIESLDNGKVRIADSTSSINLYNTTTNLDIGLYNTVNITTPSENVYSITAENLTADNIKAGVKILGKTGTYEGSGGTDTSDATATANDILSDKTAYTKDGKVTGTIPIRTSNSITVNGGFIQTLYGYYPETISKGVKHVDAAVPSIKVSDSGLITATSSQTEGYVSGTLKPTSSTYQLATQGYKEWTPTTTDQTIPELTFLTGNQVIKGDSKLIPSNIKKGAAIFGVAGTYEGSGSSDGGSTLNEDGLVQGTLTEYSNDRVGYLKSYLFQYSENLEKVSFSQALNIGEYCFDGCYSLTEVNIPNATYLSSNAFSYCESLESIDLPNVTLIESECFAECYGLCDVSIPNIEEIGAGAFMYCEVLESIDLYNVQSIYYYAFTGSGLSEVIIRGTDSVCDGDEGVFAETPIEYGEGWIYVPRSLVEEYKNSTNFCEYADQIRALEDYTIDGTVNGELDRNKVDE